MTKAAEAGASDGRRDVWRALALFCAVALGLGVTYLGSAVLFADLGVFLDPAGRFGIARLPRFNAALCLVLAYLCAAVWLAQRWARHDFEALRSVVEASDGEWARWAQRIRSPGATQLLRATLIGAVCGALVDAIAGRGADIDRALWWGHLAWVHLLNPLLFATIGVLIALSGVRAGIYQELGRRARVQLGQIAPLAPFARAGLRVALLWFVGNSLASLLLLDTNSPMLVASILILTTTLAVLALLAPSRGVHERLRDAKREELDWLRVEITRASGALRRGDAQGAAPLPALLAWEARVADAPEWPFDTSTWLRFALLLLVPVGSWLGSALAERFLERWLSA